MWIRFGENDLGRGVSRQILQYPPRDGGSGTAPHGVCAPQNSPTERETQEKNRSEALFEPTQK